MVRSVLSALILACVAPASWALESTLRDKVTALPIEFRTVHSCGSWAEGGRFGYVRVIVGDVYDGAGSEVYLQWIEQATQDRHPAVVSTTPVRELNDDHSQYTVESVACERRGRETVVKLRATYEHDTADRMHTITVRLGAVGHYRLGQQGVQRAGKVK
jgi:hypothetical protein